jgi:hypothetical protein
MANMPPRPCAALPPELEDQLARALHIVLSRPQNSWAQNFILRPGEDPAGDVSLLSNPVPLSHALVLIRLLHKRSLTSGATTDPSQTSGSLHPQAIQQVETSSSAEILLIPAWIMGSVTAGAAIIRESNLLWPQQFSGFQSLLRVGRFIRDDSTGESLVIAVGREATVYWGKQVLLYYVNHRSASRRNTFLGIFEYDAFMASRFGEALLFAEIDSHVRPCPICRTILPSGCNCSPPLRMPRNPLDFPAFVNNVLLSFHSGAYENIFSTFWRSLLLPNCNSSILRWNATKSAVLNSLKSTFIKQVNPVREWHMAVENSDQIYVLQSAALQCILGGINQSKAAVPSNRMQQDLSNLNPESQIGFETASQILEQLLAGAGQNPGDSQCERVEDESIIDTHDLNETENMGATRNINQLDKREIQNIEPTLSVFPPDETISKRIHQQKGSVTSNDDDSDQTQRCKNAASEAGSCDTSDEATPLQSLQERSSAVSSLNDALDRNSIRKKRNRAAAARSNAKRKVYLQKLRKDVEEIRTQVKALRAKESELRACNQQLKDRAVQIWRSQLKI